MYIKQVAMVKQLGIPIWFRLYPVLILEGQNYLKLLHELEG